MYNISSNSVHDSEILAHYLLVRNMDWLIAVLNFNYST